MTPEVFKVLAENGVIVAVLIWALWRYAIITDRMIANIEKGLERVAASLEHLRQTIENQKRGLYES